MSSFTQFIRKAVPIALTIVGSVATVAAVIFAADEGPRYKKALEEKEDMTTTEKVTMAVKTFAPAIACATISVACGVGAHVMDMHTQASLMGATVAIKEGYKKFVKENGEINGIEANKKLIKKAISEQLSEDERDEDGEKIHTVCLRGYSEGAPDIIFKATAKQALDREIAVNMELGEEGYLSVNRMLELFELSDRKIPEGEHEGWSVDQMIEWNAFKPCVPWLLFDNRDDKESGMLIVEPFYEGYGGYLSDYGLDY